MARHNRRWRVNRGTRITSTIIIVLVAVFAFFYGITIFLQTHFPRGTSILGVNCSWLTTQQATRKINEKLKNEAIDFWFDDGTKTEILGNEIDLTLANGENLEEILQEARKSTFERTFLSREGFSFNQAKLNESIQTMLERRPSIQKPQDASIKQNDVGFLEIVPEVYGDEFDRDRVFEVAERGLELGETTILLGGLEKVQPAIKSVDLQKKVEQINSILSSKLEIQLLDESTCTLDVNAMRNWVYQDQDGNYAIDIEQGVSNFVQVLAETAKEASSTLNFSATGIGNIMLTIPANKRAIVDQEKTIEQIKGHLGSLEACKLTPVYQQTTKLTNLSSYVEIDITRQNVWLYKDGACLVDTPCVTGMKGKHDTPTGVYTLTSKAKNATLRGRNDNGSKYASFVKYWMPFNGGIGLHDADGWRRLSEYGGTTYLYHGSHGCVNLPSSAAKTIYENIDFTMPIIVYAS
ncbi:MAG: L,D-transpeptidase family protein [Clostridia bacterium]|nr:L,D-transpeptidase family protein [Clostridia bacterium]